MIQSGRLEEFLREMFQIRKEEMEDKTTWEAWLHKVWDMDWPEFYASRNDKSSTTEAAPPQEKLKETVRDSAQMLMNFCPDGGGEQDGTVQIDGNDSG
jgi:hypothetical protein